VPHSFNHSILGCVAGGAVGDMLGGIAERGSLSLSDDTQFTLATCEALIEGAPSPERIARRMLEWFRAGRISGIGASTLKAMRDLDAGAHWALAGARGERAAGNGVAMRIAPLAFVLDPEVPDERTMIRDICRITHHHDEAYCAALAVVIAIRDVARGEPLDYARIADRIPDSVTRDNLQRLRHDLEWSAREIGTSGYAAETVPIACTLATAIIASRSFEEPIYRLNEIGGDTDTIASIAGQIAGAALGIDAVPTHEIDGEVLRIAEQFAKAIGPLKKS